MHWTVEGVAAYWVDGQPGSGGTGNKSACPKSNTTYTLKYQERGGNTSNIQVGISVVGAPVTGTYDNPVPLGSSYRFPNFGTFTVTNGTQAKSGWAIIYVTFTCELPANQKCDASNFMFDAVGVSGTVYRQEFDTHIPEPGFADIFSGRDEVYGGGTTSGYVGFYLPQQENSIKLRVHIFLDFNTEVFFKLSQ